MPSKPHQAHSSGIRQTKQRDGRGAEHAALESIGRNTRIPVDYAADINDDDAGPVSKRTRRSSHVDPAPVEVPTEQRLRRSPRIHADMGDVIEVWRSPRRRPLLSPSTIKQEPVAHEEVQVISDEAQPPLGAIPNSDAVITDRRSRREGSTETMAMCEEGSERSFGEQEGLRSPRLGSPLYPSVSFSVGSSAHCGQSQPSIATTTQSQKKSKAPSKRAKAASRKKAKNLKVKVEVEENDACSGIALPAQDQRGADESGDQGSGMMIGENVTPAAELPGEAPATHSRARRTRVKKLPAAADAGEDRERVSQDILAEKSAGRKRKVIHNGAREVDPIAESIPKLSSLDEVTPEVEVIDALDDVTEFVSLSNEWFIVAANSLSPPISQSRFTSDMVTEPLKQHLGVILRQIIDGAQSFSCDKRLTCDHINSYMSLEHRNPLYGFMEDEEWMKVGDVFVPKQKMIAASSLLETPSMKVPVADRRSVSGRMVYSCRL